VPPRSAASVPAEARGDGTHARDDAGVRHQAKGLELGAKSDRGLARVTLGQPGLLGREGFDEDADHLGLGDLELPGPPLHNLAVLRAEPYLQSGHDHGGVACLGALLSTSG